MCPISTLPDERGPDPTAHNALTRRKVGYARALVKRIRADDDAWEGKRKAEAAPPVNPPRSPEVIEAHAKLAAAKARRAEREHIATLSINEHTAYLNEQAAKKEQRKRDLARIRGRQ